MKSILVLFLLIISATNTFSQWFMQPSHTSMSITNLHFVNESTGFMVSPNSITGNYIVFKTTNSGFSWDSTILLQNEIVNQLYFVDEMTGWMIGYNNAVFPGFGLAWKTTNCGESWQSQSIGDSLKLEDICFTSQQIGFITANRNASQVAISMPEVLKTTDGGSSWFETATGFNDTSVIYGMSFINDLTGWVAFSTGTPGRAYIAKTTDGGASWVFSNQFNLISPSTRVRMLKLFDASNGYAVGDKQAEHNGDTPLIRVYTTSNGGTNWILSNVQQVEPFIHHPRSMYFKSMDTGWIVGSRGSIIKTTNRGTNWTFQQSGLDWSISRSLRDVQFVSNSGWIAGDSGKIFKTTNGGSGNLFSLTGKVRYADNLQPVRSGYVKAIKHSSGIGNIEVLDSAAIRPDGSYIVIVPQDTIDLMAFDDDEIDIPTFVPTYYPSTIEWQSAGRIFPSTNVTGLDIGVFRITSDDPPFRNISGGVYLNTDLQGLSGIKDAVIYMKSGGLFRGYSISAANGMYIADSIPAGTYQVICNRLGYQTRIRNEVLRNNDLNDINFIFGNSIVGFSGEDEIPLEFSLSANYPNPFNPVTKFRFGLPENSNVKIAVFDILGKQISILVNGEFEAGFYNIAWDGSSHPSGVYFYRLEAGDFTETKKMILLK